MMATVYCASIECKYHDGNKCTAKKIALSAGSVHTVWNGIEDIWYCKQFELSDKAKCMQAEIKRLIGGDGNG